jgi:hypothetical protein
MCLALIGSFALTAQAQSELTINLKSGSETDSAIIYFYRDGLRVFNEILEQDDGYSDGFDLFTVSTDGQLVTSNGIPNFDCDESVPLIMFNVADGHYTFEFLRQRFSDQISIQLLDHFTNSITNVIMQPSYEFDVTADPNSYNAGRFEIRFLATPASQDFKLRGSERCQGLDGEIEILNSRPGTIYTIIQDYYEVDAIIGTGDTVRYVAPAETLKDGYNNFHVKSGFSYCQTNDYKNVNIVVNQRFTTPVVDAYRCDEGSVELKATMIPEGGVFKWYDSPDAETPIITQSGSIFKTPVLDQTTTYYVSSTTVVGCEGPRQAVSAEITMAQPVVITTSGDTLRSNYAFGNQWYLNGEVIPGAISEEFIATKSGVYAVTVNIRSCSSTASFEYGDTKIVMTAHPNPVATTVTVQILGVMPHAGHLRVHNTVGKQVATVPLYVEDDKLVGQIDMTDFPVGIYVVRVGGEESTELKLIKL